MAYNRSMEIMQWRLEVPDSEDVGVFVDVVEGVVSGVEPIHPHASPKCLVLFGRSPDYGRVEVKHSGNTRVQFSRAFSNL